MLFTFDKFTIPQPNSFVNYFLKNSMYKIFLPAGDFCTLQQDIAKADAGGPGDMGDRLRGRL